MSRYLYFILSSSPPSVSSSIVNGGVLERFKIVSLFTSISISPVKILLFLDCLSITKPFTCITNSRFNFLASRHEFSFFLTSNAS